MEFILYSVLMDQGRTGKQEKVRKFENLRKKSEKFITTWSEQEKL